MSVNLDYTGKYENPIYSVISRKYGRQRWRLPLHFGTEHVYTIILSVHIKNLLICSYNLKKNSLDKNEIIIYLIYGTFRRKKHRIFGHEQWTVLYFEMNVTDSLDIKP